PRPARAGGGRRRGTTRRCSATVAGRADSSSRAAARHARRRHSRPARLARSHHATLHAGAQATRGRPRDCTRRRCRRGGGRGGGAEVALVWVGRAWLAVSIDLTREEVHFRTAWPAFADIGWRSAAAALSDLAADAAEPSGVVVSLGVPRKGRGRGKGEGDPAA